MNRRAYLATAGAVTFAGCSALTDADSEPADDNGDENGDGNGDENGDGNGDENGSSDPIDEEPGSFDAFEDLSAWTVMEGSLVADEERAIAGTQSARMEADATDDRAMIKREFDSPRDLSTEFPALAFASDHDVSPTIQLTDADGDRMLLQCSVAADGPLVRRDLAITDVLGDPDLSSIVHTKISFWAGDRDLTLWCDDYHFVERPDTGLVSLQFPNESILDDAASVLEAYDYPATAFVSTDYVGTEGHPSLSELESLRDDGWTIASKGATGTDPTQLDASQQEDQLSTAATWLDDHGFDDAFFSYPLNRYDETALDLVAEYHDLAFVSGHAGHGHVTNPQLAPRATNPDADEAAQLLEWAAEYGTIVTLSFRSFEDETIWFGENRSLAEFEDTLSMLSDLEADGDLEVVSPADLASEYLH